MPGWKKGKGLKDNVLAKYGTKDYFDVVFTCGGDAKYPTEYKKERTVVDLKDKWRNLQKKKVDAPMED